MVLLNPPSSSSVDLPATTDPDSLITCELMDGRDAFLNLAREKHWEFSSLRRAKYSSISMLYELHNQGGADRFVYTCNGCSADIEIRYHCKECEVQRRGRVLFPFVCVSLVYDNNMLVLIQLFSMIVIMIRPQYMHLSTNDCLIMYCKMVHVHIHV